MLKRHEIQVLRRAGHSQEETGRLAGVSVRSVRRVEDEAAVSDVDNAVERRAPSGRRALQLIHVFGGH